MNRPVLVIPFLLLITLGCSPAGQSDNETSPLAGASVEAELLDETACLKPGNKGRFYPLAIGNVWFYSRVFSLDGEITSTSQITQELVGHEELFGRTYVLEESRLTESAFGGTRVFTTWVRFRQDRAGLYEAIKQPPTTTGGRPSPKGDGRNITLAAGQSGVDWLVSKVAPGDQFAAYRAALIRNLELHEMIRDLARSASFATAASPPGGPKTEEITRLRYPLHPGQSWTIRESPFFGSTVEQREILALPVGRRAAWRIRIDSELFGPDDEVYLWYSRCGRLGLYARLEGVAMDENGDVIGTFVTEENELLEGLDLKDRPACDR
jgi:hypothetical protein